MPLDSYSAPVPSGTDSPVTIFGNEKSPALRLLSKDVLAGMAPDEHHFLVMMPHEELDKFFARGGILLGIESGDQLQAALLFRVLPPAENPYSLGSAAYIANVMVHPDARGKRHVDRLLAKAEELACARGIIAQLLCHAIENERAARCFERHGFELFSQFTRLELGLVRQVRIKFLSRQPADRERAGYDA
jgi:ribosomal protein S18 acetylase RimI-like enzyme